eukprot:scaffold17958_cov55-Phaeocystis_antarctica.AAC.2
MLYQSRSRDGAVATSLQRTSRPPVRTAHVWSSGAHCLRRSRCLCAASALPACAASTAWVTTSTT